VTSKQKKILIIISITFVFILGLWISLPTIAEKYINHALSHVEGYEGSVKSVGLHHILRGAVVVNGVDIKKKNGKVTIPFVSVKKTDFTFQWGELFRGHIVGTLKLDSPNINFVSGATEEQSQLKVKKEWQDVVSELLPVKLNRFSANNGQVHFVSTNTKPAVDIYLTDLQIKGENLSNTREKGNKLFSTINMTGKTLGNGTFKLDAKANPLTKPLPAFQLDLQVRNVDLVALNKFFQAYGKFDVEKGKFDFFFEMDSTPTTYKGYAKPMISQIEVLDWEKDSKKKNFIEVVWQGLVGTVASVFENQPKDRIATEMPFSGTWKKTDVGIFETVLNLLGNAFIKALVPGFEGTSKNVS
jgi:hypothetical protein